MKSIYLMDGFEAPEWVESPAIFQHSNNTVFGYFVTGKIDENTLTVTPMESWHDNPDKRTVITRQDMESADFYWSVDEAVAVLLHSINRKEHKKP